MMRSIYAAKLYIKIVQFLKYENMLVYSKKEMKFVQNGLSVSDVVKDTI